MLNLLPIRPLTAPPDGLIASLSKQLPQLTADRFRLYSPEIKNKILSELSPEEGEMLLFNWEFWRRSNQVPPEEFLSGEKTTWFVKAGRGFGKTRCGGEMIRYWVKIGFQYVNLIGPTADDIRDAMIEGESGVLAICPPDERPEYIPSRRKLQWPNGATSLLFSAEEPERLRNKQHEKLWCDEIAAWQYPETWDQAQFGLRLGSMPQAVVTSTPRPTALVKELEASATTVVTRGTSYENRDNLAPTFYAKIVAKYEGTRLGRQELLAETLSDNPGALFHLSNIEKNRVFSVPTDLERVVVAIDPAVTSKEESDETGIVSTGRDKRFPPHFYVFEDNSDIMTPDGWAKRAVNSYHANKADRIIGEVNNGGEMVESTVRHVDPNVSYKAVHASRGKVVRAEPISALYEQNRVHHVGILGKLEDQMTDFNPSTYRPGTDPSPDRMDALVWGLTELADSYSGDGLVEYMRSGRADTDMKKMMAMNKVQGASNLAKPVIADEAPGCPKCPSKLFVRIADDNRCQECGHQWSAVKRPANEQASRILMAKLGSRVM